jgi:thiol-disulfide isomerase/thioredoxin
MGRIVALSCIFLGAVLIGLTFVPRKPPTVVAATQPAYDDPKTRKSPLVGQPSPPFSLELLTGGKADLAAHKGKDVIVLDFWATWCAPCIRTMPKMDALVKKFADKGVVLYAVNDSESRQEIEAFVKERKIDIPIAMDPKGELVTAFGAEELPVSAIIDKDGVVRAVHYGFFEGMTDVQIEKELTELTK